MIIRQALPFKKISRIFLMMKGGDENLKNSRCALDKIHITKKERKKGIQHEK